MVVLKDAKILFISFIQMMKFISYSTQDIIKAINEKIDENDWRLLEGEQLDNCFLLYDSKERIKIAYIIQGKPK